MARIEKILRDLSDMFDFYEKIKEHKREKGRAGKPNISERSTEKSRQRTSDVRGKYKRMSNSSEDFALRKRQEIELEG